MKLSTFALPLAGALLITACGSNDRGDNPIGPSAELGSAADLVPGTGVSTGRLLIGGQTCRVFPAQAVITTTANGVTTKTDQTCSYNGGTQATCTSQSTDSTGAVSTTTATSEYASVSDIVDEVQVIPPLTKVLTVNSTQTSATGTTPVTITNAYDAQGRIVSFTGSTAAGAITTNYTAWDAAGRPTVAETQIPGVPFGAGITVVYDDAARTATLTTGVAGFQIATVNTYDTDGNLVSTVVTGPGQSTTTTVAIVATGTVCK